MSEEEKRKNEKEKGSKRWGIIALALIIAIAFTGMFAGLGYFIPTEKTYGVAYLQMDVFVKMPHDYFPALLVFNETFLEKYEGEKRCGYVFAGDETKVVGYECMITFERDIPTKEEILNHLLIYKCLQYEKDTARGGRGAYFKILSPKPCMVTVNSVSKAEDYKLCTYDDFGGMTDDCVVVKGCKEMFYHPTEKLALMNSTGFVANITIPFSENIDIVVK